MTPDQFLSTMHRQRADQMAMRLALADLAKCLAPEQRDGWLSALAARTESTRTAAQSHPDPDQAAGLQELARALQYLHKGLSTP